MHIHDTLLQNWIQISFRLQCIPCVCSLGKVVGGGPGPALVDFMLIIFIFY